MSEHDVREPPIKIKIREMMKVSDTAGQMVACSVAYSIFMGVSSPADITIRHALRSLVLYECTGTEFYTPLSEYIGQSLATYPISFFRSKDNCSAILEAYREYYKQFAQLTIDLLRIDPKIKVS